MALLIQPQTSVYDQSGNRVLDGRLYVYQAGTTTPVPVYIDSGLNNRHTMPIEANGNGIMPIAYVLPGTYDLRFTDPEGYVYDEVDALVIDAPASSGGGGGGTTDPLRLAQTGDVKHRYGKGTHPGWARLNGRTIGSAASAGSERANDDAHDLFVFLWSQDSNLAVSGGRGSTAESDWAAAKTIALPDARGRLLAALDDMGNTAAGRLNGGLFTFGGATTLGSYGGEASHVQTLSELASHPHTVTATMDSQGGHNHTGTTDAYGGGTLGIPYVVSVLGFASGNNFLPQVQSVGQPGSNAVGQTQAGLAHSHTFTTSAIGGHAHNITASASNAGSGAAMNWLPPFLLVSVYVKL